MVYEMSRQVLPTAPATHTHAQLSPQKVVESGAQCCHTVKKRGGGSRPVGREGVGRARASPSPTITHLTFCIIDMLKEHADGGSGSSGDSVTRGA